MPTDSRTHNPYVYLIILISRSCYRFSSFLTESLLVQTAYDKHYFRGCIKKPWNYINLSLFFHLYPFLSRSSLSFILGQTNQQVPSSLESTSSSRYSSDRSRSHDSQSILVHLSYIFHYKHSSNLVTSIANNLEFNFTYRYAELRPLHLVFQTGYTTGYIEQSVVPQIDCLI